MSRLLHIVESYEMLQIKLMCMATSLLTTMGAIQVLNEDTLIPVGLLSGALFGSVWLTWKIAGIHFKMQADLTKMREELDSLKKK